jgi:hypothetical protein
VRAFLGQEKQSGSFPLPSLAGSRVVAGKSVGKQTSNLLNGSTTIFVLKSGSSSDRNPTAVKYILWSLPGW